MNQRGLYEVAVTARYGLAGKVLFATAAASVLWAFVLLLGMALHRTRFRFGERTQRIWLWGGLTLAVVAISATFLLVETARSSFLNIALHYLRGTPLDIDPSERARLIAEARSITYASTRAAAETLIVLGAGAIAGAALWLRGPARSVVASSALTGLVIAYAVLSRQSIMCYPSETNPFDRNEHLRCIAERNDGNTHLLLDAKIAVFVVCAVVAVIAIGIVLRRGAPWGPQKHVLAAVSLFLFGASAFALTRARAHDTSQKPEAHFQGEVCSYLDSDLPPAHRQCDGTERPTVVIAGNTASIDGIPVATQAELRKVLDSKASLWRQVNPERAFPGTALIAASPHASPRDVLPWLRVVEASDFARGAAVTALPGRVAHTATIGAVPHSQRCCFSLIPVGAAADDGALARFQTWGDFVASLESSN